MGLHTQSIYGNQYWNCVKSKNNQKLMKKKRYKSHIWVSETIIAYQLNQHRDEHYHVVTQLITSESTRRQKFATLWKIWPISALHHMLQVSVVYPPCKILCEVTGFTFGCSVFTRHDQLIHFLHVVSVESHVVDMTDRLLPTFLPYTSSVWGQSSLDSLSSVSCLTMPRRSFYCASSCNSEACCHTVFISSESFSPFRTLQLAMWCHW